MPQAAPEVIKSRVIADPKPIDFCLYCLKPASEVGVLIRANGLPICRECIKKCFKIISEYYPEEIKD